VYSQLCSRGHREQPEQKIACGKEREAARGRPRGRAAAGGWSGTVLGELGMKPAFLGCAGGKDLWQRGGDLRREQAKRLRVGSKGTERMAQLGSLFRRDFLCRLEEECTTGGKIHLQWLQMG